MLKYFLAEGIISEHSTLIASQDVNPSNIVSSYNLLDSTVPVSARIFTIFRSKNCLL